MAYTFCGLVEINVYYKRLAGEIHWLAIHSYQCRGVPGLVGKVKGDTRWTSGERYWEQVVCRDHMTCNLYQRSHDCHMTQCTILPTGELDDSAGAHSN